VCVCVCECVCVCVCARVSHMVYEEKRKEVVAVMSVLYACV